jgi:hypothetical protein
MPTDELENELRRTLARTAADFESPDQARQRLLQRDYHPRRGNRRLAAGIIAAAAGVALVTGLGLSGVFGSASHQPSHPAHAQLAAWTVVKQADGTVSVTIREFRDPAGLQRELRADGVPASVIFYPGRLRPGEPFRDLFDVKNNPCLTYSGGQGQLLKVVKGPRPARLGEQSTISIIHPSALPSGAGVQFIATRNVGYLQSRDRHALGVWLVQASRQCTGS